MANPALGFQRVPCCLEVFKYLRGFQKAFLFGSTSFCFFYPQLLGKGKGTLGLGLWDLTHGLSLFGRSNCDLY